MIPHRSGLLATALAALLPASALAATFTVTKTADTADGVCNADCSLREAVIAANAAPGADRIVVPAGTYVLTRTGAGEDLAAAGDLDITESVAVQGVGRETTIVDGGGADRVFHVLATLRRAEFQGLTIRNGAVSGAGDAGAGGGIFGYRTDVSIVDCAIENNSAQEGGGALVRTIPAEIGRASLNVFDSAVAGNSASGPGGGLVVGAYARGLVADSTVSDNDAVGRGGGLVCGALSEVDVLRSAISGNTAFQGGGVAAETTLRCRLAGSVVENNQAASTGGGIVAPGNVSVIASAIRNNSAASGGGGIGNPFAAFSGDILIEDSTISGNTSAAASGGIGNFGGTITIRRSLLANNSAVTFGGGMGVSGGTHLIENTTFTGNSVSSPNGDNGIKGGGAIAVNRFSGGAVTLRHATLAGNASPTAGREVSCTGCGAPNIAFVNTVVAGAGADNCSGPFSSGGGNLDSGNSCGFTDPTDQRDVADPKLAALADNGGLAQTRALQAGSPAIGAARVLDPKVASDQRGSGRDADPDSGAYERVGAGGAATSCPGDSEGVRTLLAYAVEDFLPDAAADAGEAADCLRSVAGLP